MKRTILYLLPALLLATACLDDANPSRKIRQSIQKFEDNVNGWSTHRIKDTINNVQETTNFYYNSDGSLGRVTVYDDITVSATLLKDITVEYVPADNRVILNTFHYIDGYRTLYFNYNDKKQITSLVDTLGNGLYITYVDDKIQSFKDSSGLGVLHYINFVYDAQNNLLQYELAINNDPPVAKASLEYWENTPITEELDTRFFNKDIKFIYIGGLNLVTKLGLNFGLSNSNALKKRTEAEIMSGNVLEVYRFNYDINENGINKRDMEWSTDTLYYKFEY